VYKRLTFFLLIFAIVSFHTQADIFKVIGPDGKVSYTDTEPKAASTGKTERLKIQTYSGAPAVSSINGMAKRVTIFSAQWCGVCREAKSYMKTHNIAFEEWDIDKSEYAKSKLNEFKASGIPVILVGNQKMIGFSPEAFEAMRKTARTF